MSYKKNIAIIFVILMTAVVLPSQAFAQSGTESADSTESAESSNSANESSESALPSELPQTGAADVFVLTAAGLIFISAGIFSARTANEVFTEIENE